NTIEVQLAALRLSESTEYKGEGRNIFRAEPEPPPKPITPVVTPPPPQPQAYVPPPPPPINLKFFGVTNRAGEGKKALLLQGDAVFVAAEGDIVNNRYKIVHIGNNSIDVMDVLNNNTQTLPLVQT